MKKRISIIILLAVMVVLLAAAESGAVGTRAIDKVRNKGVLDDSDLQTIDDFLAEAVEELARTRDFSSVSKVQSAISLRRNSKVAGGSQSQYSEQFSESSAKYIKLGFERANELEEQDRRFKVTFNLLVLMDNLADPRLTNMAMDYVKDENAAIRYQAICCVTSSDLLARIKLEGGNSELTEAITEQLIGLASEASEEILPMMARFAGQIDDGGEKLLLAIADERIAVYADWSVKGEIADAYVLEALYKKMGSGGFVRPAVARRFGQLYSYAMQRYAKGQDYLSDEQKQQLASVLVEVEKSCIGKVPAAMPQTTIKRAVEFKDCKTLLLEHGRLLGEQGKAGQLGVKLDFDYGKGAGGGKRTAPLELSEPPEREKVVRDGEGKGF